MLKVKKAEHLCRLGTMDIKSFAKVIKTANTITLTTHLIPDPDGIGSMIALGYALQTKKESQATSRRRSLRKISLFRPERTHTSISDRISPKNKTFLLF